MNADEKNRYFQELSRNLRHEGLTVKPETEEGLLPVELDGQRLCLALDSGAIRYWREDAADDRRSAALDRVTDVAKITAEYMRQMEAAPQLTASGLTGDYRLLAEFNDTVLAGHPSKYGIQFVTWEWVQDHTALYQGIARYATPVDIGLVCYGVNFRVRYGFSPHMDLGLPRDTPANEAVFQVFQAVLDRLQDEMVPQLVEVFGETPETFYQHSHVLESSREFDV